MDYNSPGYSVHGILLARILESVAIPSPGDLLKPGIELMPPALQEDSLPLNHKGNALADIICSWLVSLAILKVPNTQWP